MTDENSRKKRSKSISSIRVINLVRDVVVGRDFLENAAVQIAGWPEASAVLNNVRCAAANEEDSPTATAPQLADYKSVDDVKAELVSIRQDLTAACRERGINPEPILVWIQRVIDSPSVAKPTPNSATAAFSSAQSIGYSKNATPTVGPPAVKATPAGSARAEDNDVSDLVTLDEAAAIVHRSKRTLENYLRRMPAPHIQGGGGKPSLWKWNVLRPWLESQFIPDLPRRFPRNIR